MELEQKEHWINETIAFLAITSIKGVGFWSMHKIASNEPGFKDLLKSDSAESLNQYLRHKIPLEDMEWSSKQEELWSSGLEFARSLVKQGVRLIFRDQAEFPESLKKIPDAPYWIFVQGNLQNLNQKSVAIVGTRKATNDGLFLTKLVVAALVGEGVTTVSGLAAGVDQCAHIESIRFNIPTVAVLGTGILNNYPAGSESIRSEILDNGGTIVSEYLPNQLYSAENFVRRNRIQAALCETLVPVEWNIKSGTAHTVEFAHKYRKKIANVYLPGTHEHRKELAFSADHRGATSFLLPKSIKEFICYVVHKLPDETVLPTERGGEQKGFGF